ncbi:MAG: hypothetical protein RKE49_04530 [Oceanicaulis sp.]
MISRFVRITIASFLIGMAPCSSVFAFSAEEILFEGRLEAERVERFILNNPTFATLSISSHGGEELAALRLAEHILENRADVVVNETCMSACALYVLPAANTVHLSEDSLVAVHPGIVSSWNVLETQFHPDRLDSAFRENSRSILAFYDRVGVNPRIFADAISAHAIWCLSVYPAQTGLWARLRGRIGFWVPTREYWGQIGVEMPENYHGSVDEIMQIANLRSIPTSQFSYRGTFPQSASAYSLSQMVECPPDEY